MKRAGLQPWFTYHPDCEHMQLTHPLFVDDVLIFCKAHPPTLQIIMRALNEFHTCVGLQSNQSKTQIVFGGCNTHLQQQYLQITGFQEGGLPLKYLGIPITTSRLSKLECRILLDKIMGKLKIWSTKSISFTGRAQLLNSIIFDMYNYWATIFILPQDVIDNINQMCRNYLCGGTPDSKRIPFISWNTTCLPRKHGGFGLKNLVAWNKTCIAKLVWVVAAKKDILWVKWVHEIPQKC